MRPSATYTPPPVSPWSHRLGLGALLLGILAALWWGWNAWSSGWTPDHARWPTQGVAISGANLPIDWARLQRAGVSFAYIDATASGRQSSGYTRAHDGAVAAGLRVGAIHHFDVCALANEQAGAFVRIVPREAAALPPAVMLDVHEPCARRPTRALLLTELSTFLTQVETHAGKSAVVSPSQAVEADYAVASAVDRPLWLRRNRAEPDGDSGPWTIWGANDAALIDGARGRLRWLVLNDGAGNVTDGERR